MSSLGVGDHGQKWQLCSALLAAGRSVRETATRRNLCATMKSNFTRQDWVSHQAGIPLSGAVVNALVELMFVNNVRSDFGVSTC